MDLLRTHNVNVPKGQVAYSPEEAKQVAKSLDTTKLIIKAQVLAGGRGKGVFANGFKSGVHTSDSPEKIESIAYNMLKNKLITNQTGEKGRICNSVYVCERIQSQKEYYFAITMDSFSNGPVIIASSQGGMDIEKVAKETPNAIVKRSIHIDRGLDAAQAKDISLSMGIPLDSVDDASENMLRLYKMFISFDCTLIEINPLATNSDGKIVCMDSKINFDDNSSFRQSEIFKFRDWSQEDEREVEASKFNLNYIGLDGNIGCLVNGAGLAMATMDIIKLYGGKPANFLDIGGGATQQQVFEAIRILCSDPKVSAIFVNIFGGIMRCDIVAMGIIEAVQKLQLKVPIVIRLQGTCMEEAKKLLEQTPHKLIQEDDLSNAAKKVTSLIDKQL